MKYCAGKYEKRWEEPWNISDCLYFWKKKLENKDEKGPVGCLKREEMTSNQCQT